MNLKEEIRLLKKFKIKSLGDGMWGDGFLEGLQKAERYYLGSRLKPKASKGDEKE